MTRSPIDAGLATTIAVRARPPHSRAHTLDRTVLLDRLSSSLDHQVVVIQAPAGFGKTTLLHQAMLRFGSEGVDCGWLTIDPSDGQSSGLIRGLAQSLTLAGAAANRPWPEALAALDGADDEACCAILVHALARRGNRVLLILDGCHLADTTLFNASLDRLVHCLPDTVRVILSGRGRPQVSFSTLRTRGLVAELMATDLLFTRSEAEALFGGPFPGGTAALMERSEGWPAMLQLALQLGDATALGGSKRPMHPVLREYLADQIIDALSPSLRDLLVKCSIFPQFCADLAEAVTGVTMTHGLRHEMAQLAPLIAPVDGRADWVRMHPMLRDALMAELEQSPKPAITQLHRLAANWFGARNDLESAVRHARAAENFTLAADTIERAGGVRLFIRAGNAVLSDLLGKLPPAVIHSTYGLRLARAVVVAKQGRVQDARHLADEVREAYVRNHPSGQAETGTSFEDIEHIDDLIKIYEDREVDAATIAARERTIDRIEVSDTWMRGWIYNHLTIQLCRFGDLRRAQQAAHQSLACYREEGSTYVQVFMFIHLGLIAVASGRIAMSLEPSREAETLVDAAHAQDDGLRAIAQVPIAEALYAKNDLAGPRRRLDFAIPVMAAGEGWVDIFARALETRIRIALVEEGLGAAIAFLDRGYEIAESRGLWRLRWTMDAMRHEVLCRTNLLVEADEIGLALARDIAADATHEGHLLTWREKLAGSITLARGALCRNNPAAAIGWLDAAIAQGEALGAFQWLIPAFILRAIAKDRSGDAESALNSIQRAVAIAAPQGVVRPFIDEGRAITSLIRQILRRFGIGSLSAANTEFVASILNPAGSDSADETARSGSLLSEREHEILGLLNHGLANKEIARSVGVSEATVKFHLKNLYGKLGVNSRVMALAVARQQRLLH